MLNALKLNMSALVSFKLGSDGDTAFAVALLVTINMIPFVLMSTLIVNRN